MRVRFLSLDQSFLSMCETSPPRLQRGLNTLHATSLNVANMLGAGPFITIPILLAAMSGPQAMIGWFVAMIIDHCYLRWTGLVGTGRRVSRERRDVSFSARDFQGIAVGTIPAVSVHLAVSCERNTRGCLGLHRRF
jgi:hypothetical protein